MVNLVELEQRLTRRERSIDDTSAILDAAPALLEEVRMLRRAVRAYRTAAVRAGVDARVVRALTALYGEGADGDS